MAQTSTEESRKVDGTSGESVNYVCYACSEFVNWLAPDGRCSDCTNFTPEELC
jgi:hypothetical protein